MTRSVVIPSELQPFVQAEIASGAFRDEAHLVAKALQLYRDLKARHTQLRTDVQRSIEQAERGDVDELDIEQTIARGYDRLAQEGIAD
jgi:Arc/MetJ-type ribon-helix-helix transcriptional regulator